MKTEKQTNSVTPRIALPDLIVRRFVQLRRKLFVRDCLQASCLSVVGILGGFLASFALDRLFDSPVWLRFLCFFAGWMVFVTAWLLWLRSWTWRYPTQKALAVLVQKQFRNLGDRLLSIVELAQEKQHPANYSERLYQAAIQQVADAAEPYDFDASIARRLLKRLALIAGVAFVLGVTIRLILPGATQNAWARWLHPFADIPRYTLVEIGEMSPHKIVAHGEPFTLPIAAHYHSFWKPDRIRVEVPGRSNLEFHMNGGIAELELPGITTETTLTFRLGDDRSQLTIFPVHRPTLRSLTATIQWPDYLKHPESQATLERGNLELLEGSRIQFKGTADRKLKTATYGHGGETLGPLTMDGEAFESSVLDPAGLFEIQFTWEDEHGLTNAAPWPLSLNWFSDQGPTPRFDYTGLQLLLLETEVLELKTLINDDYGIREFGLRWHVLEATASETTEPARQVITETVENYTTRQVEHSFFFSPSVYQLPANTTVELRVYAQDAYPGRRMSVSDPLQIHVIGNEDHFDFVRSELESVLARLEEISRLEDELALETGKLSQMDLEAQDVDELEVQERLEAIAQEQDRNAEGLKQLAMDGARALREAMRNPMFDDQSLQDWAGNIREMQELANQEMGQVSKSLRSASQSSENRQADVEAAETTEREILEALAELQSQVNEELDQLEAMTLAQRLRKKGREEHDIALSLQDIISSTIGLRPEELSQNLDRKNRLIAAEQLEKTLETEALMGEISRYFERTEETLYGTVVDEMKTKQTDQALRQLSEDIERNIAMYSIQNLAKWTRQFNVWADMLEPERESGDSGEGGGEGGEQAENPDIKHLMALLRVREEEVGLRRKTEMLIEQWNQLRDAEGSARNLGETQGEIGAKVRDVQFETLNFDLESVLNQAFKSMQSAETDLRLAKVGDPVIRSESASITRLSDAINLINEKLQPSQSNSSESSPSSSAQDMAFLLQIMSMAPTPGLGMQPGGSQPGGNTQGGAAQNPTLPLTGNRDGNQSGERKIETGSGVVQQTPMEFRQALERYFKALEKAGY